MTNEEAIKQLNIHKSTNVWADSIAEAIDMAIEALQAKTDGDTISRQAAIKNAHFPMIDDAGYEIVRVDDILGLPSVEPKREECEEREQGLCPFYAG